MLIPFRESTSATFLIPGQFVDDTDFKTPETALSIANTDIKLNKHASTSFVSKNSGGATHISDGFYYTVLDVTDTSTIGRLSGKIVVAGALAVWFQGIVMPANVYDALILGSGSDLLDVSIAQINGSANAAQALQKVHDTVVFGNAITGTLSTTQATTNLSSSYATNDQLKGKQITWEGNVTAALTGQSSFISSYNGTSKLLTFDTMTTQPANLDRFVIT